MISRGTSKLLAVVIDNIGEGEFKVFTIFLS